MRMKKCAASKKGSNHGCTLEMEIGFRKTWVPETIR